MKAGIIGMGTLGQAQLRWLGADIHVTYDPQYDGEYPAGLLAECDFVIVCVPAEQVEAAIKDIPFGRPVLLRSTVPPGTTEKFETRVVYCPDFITDPTTGNWRDPDDVPFLILGGEGSMTMKFRRWLAPRFGGAILRCSSRVAEIVKYTDALFLATKVTFANEMARIASCYGVDWRDVEPLWKMDPRTGYSHTSVTEFGGFGNDLPRYLADIIYAASLGDYNADFLMAVEEANARFQQ